MVIAFSVIMGVMLCLAVAEAPDIPFRLKPLTVALEFVGASSLIAVVLYINGTLRSRAGRQIGGHASAWDLSAAVAWSMIPWLLFFVLGLVMSPYFQRHPEFVKDHLLGAYFLLALGPICLVWGYLLGRASLLELQGFTAAQGRKAALIGVTIQMRWFLSFVLIVLGVTFAVFLLARFLR